MITHMTGNKLDPKAKILQERGALHPHPENVSAELFAEHEFFDARDLVQVKYEMLRRVDTGEKSITQSAAEFGLSRPTYYQARAAFEREGLDGLRTKKPGPRSPHKLSEEVIGFVREVLAQRPESDARALARSVEQRFGFSVHPRTIQRALVGSKKKRTSK